MAISIDNIFGQMLSVLLVGALVSGGVYYRDDERPDLPDEYQLLGQLSGLQKTRSKLMEAEIMPPLFETMDKVKLAAAHYNLKFTLIGDKAVLGSAYKGPAAMWGGRLTGDVGNLLAFASDAQRSRLLIHFGQFRVDANGVAQMIFAITGVGDGS